MEEYVGNEIGKVSSWSLILVISMTLSRIRREVRIRLRSEKAASPGERGLDPQLREFGTYSILSVGKVGRKNTCTSE